MKVEAVVRALVDRGVLEPVADYDEEAPCTK